jgi:hypothetical protein
VKLDSLNSSVIRWRHCEFRPCEPKAKQSRSHIRRHASLRSLLRPTILTAPYASLDCFASLAMTVQNSIPAWAFTPDWK